MRHSPDPLGPRTNLMQIEFRSNFRQIRHTHQKLQSARDPKFIVSIYILFPNFPKSSARVHFMIWTPLNRQMYVYVCSSTTFLLEWGIYRALMLCIAETKYLSDLVFIETFDQYIEKIKSFLERPLTSW